MTLVHMDGFDFYESVSDFPTNYTYDSSYTDITTTNGRFDGGALIINGTNKYNTNELMVEFPASITGTAIVQAAVFPDKTADHKDKKPFLELVDGSATLDSGVNPAAAVSLWMDGTFIVEDSAGNTWDISSYIPVKGVWTYVELKADSNSSSANIVVRINGQEILNVTGDTSAVNDIRKVIFCAVYNIDNIYWDDIIVMDGSGTKNNDFLGDRRIATIFPNGDGDTTDYTPLNGGANYEEVDENPGFDGDTTYNYANTVDSQDLFTHENLPFNANSINAIQLKNKWRKDGTETREASSVLKSGTTVTTGSPVTLSTSYTDDINLFETNPDTGSDWTESDVNNIQAGYKITT